MAMFDLNPLDVGLPHDRPRFYFLVVRRDLVDGVGWDEAGFRQRSLQLLQQLLRGHRQVELDEFLFVESHPEVARAEATASNRDRARRVPTQPLKWVSKHRAMYSDPWSAQTVMKTKKANQ